VVEVARLESVYRFIAYRGFESPSLRQGYKNKKPPSGGFFVFASAGGEKQAPCGACAGDSKGWAYFAQPSPNRPTAAAARQPRAPWARVRGSN
jgi:hypothetical protein